MHSCWIHEFMVVLKKYSKHVFFIIWNRWVRLGVDWVNFVLLFVCLIWRYAYLFYVLHIVSDDSRILELQNTVVLFWADFSFKIVGCILGAACYCLGVILILLPLNLGNIWALCIDLLTLVLWLISLIVIVPSLGVRSCFFIKVR
jgi:hypothetical protein